VGEAKKQGTAKKMKKVLDPRHLPYFGAVVQAVLFAIAGNSFFPIFGWLAGLGVGAVVNWSLAVASSRVSDIAKNRKPLAYLSLACLFCLSPVIICSTMGWSVANFSWSVASDLSILLTGAIVGKGLVTSGDPLPKAARNKQKDKQQVPQEVVKVARKTVQENELLAYLQANAGASQTQVAEHFGVSRQAIGSRIKKIYKINSEAEIK
jgi:MFS family permease